MAERAERPGLDERLDGALVEHRHVDAFGEVVEAREVPVGRALVHHVLDEPGTDVAHRRQTEHHRAERVRLRDDVGQRAKWRMTRSRRAPRMLMPMTWHSLR